MPLAYKAVMNRWRAVPPPTWYPLLSSELTSSSRRSSRPLSPSLPLSVPPLPERMESVGDNEHIASMLSLADSICLCDGGADSANDGESGLDLLRDEDGNTYESSRYHTDDGATLHRFMAAM
ncbi:hypothetical protein Tco_1485272 [Tanacetum coccineum]